jgi:hypothetical protein
MNLLHKSQDKMHKFFEPLSHGDTEKTIKLSVSVVRDLDFRQTHVRLC